ADCLLNLHGGAFRAVLPNIRNAHIAAAPEIVHVLLLGHKQLLEPLSCYTIQCPLGTTAQLFSRSGMGAMINHVLGEVDWTAAPGVNGEGNLPEVLSVHDLVGVRT